MKEFKINLNISGTIIINDGDKSKSADFSFDLFNSDIKNKKPAYNNENVETDSAISDSDIKEKNHYEEKEKVNKNYFSCYGDFLKYLKETDSKVDRDKDTDDKDKKENKDKKTEDDKKEEEDIDLGKLIRMFMDINKKIIMGEKEDIDLGKLIKIFMDINKKIITEKQEENEYNEYIVNDKDSFEVKKRPLTRKDKNLAKILKKIE